MNQIEEQEKKLIEEFEFLGDWMEKYEYIIDLGKELEPMAESLKTESNKIKGCQSQVWLFPSKKDGEIHFSADSDALITKGIIALLLRVINHQEASAIAAYDFRFVDAIGLKEHLSPNRSNGLVSMIKQIKLYALALQN
ncbi:MAG TPA: SufE family protein [Luteibaculaceae bacterium]|jgi:cysteine desulfuration protein SufE|nr:SufE family protein [Luteibaculaceae bacterium]